MHSGVTWNAMILAHVDLGEGWRQWNCSEKWLWKGTGVELHAVSLIRMQNVCASVAAVDEVRHVHIQIIDNGG